MKKKKIILSIIMIVCIALLSVSALADMGGYSGDSDYGYDSGSSYDYDDYDYGSSGYYDDDDNDYYYGGSSSGGHSSGGSGGGMFWPVAIVVIILYIIVRSRGNKSKARPGAANRPEGAKRTDISTLRPMSEYTQIDPEFSAEELSDKLSNLYVQMQNGWQDKNIDSLRPYFTDELFTQFNRQLDAMKNKGQTNYVERIAVLGVTLLGFKQVKGEDHIIAELRTRIVDYTVDDRTGNLVSGDKNLEKFMTYEWDLSRAEGIKTVKEGGIHKVNCPNCGAPVEINASAKCPFCETVITLDEHNWAIGSIKGISQQTR